MVYGYLRVSTKKQSIERQATNIAAAFPTANLDYRDYFTGTKTDGRPGWNKLMARVQANDTIVFDSVSRMSRNASEGYELYQELFRKGVELVFLKEPHINTSTYKQALQSAVPMTGTTVDVILQAINDYLQLLIKSQVRLAYDQAEKEVRDLRTRTAEGMRVSGAGAKISKMKEGKRVTTQKSIAAKKIILDHSKTFGGSLSDDQVLKLAGISRGSLFKYKRELKSELEEGG